MNDTDMIAALEAQAKNTKYLIDRLNRALYGFTFDEIIKLLGGNHDGEQGRGKSDPRDAE